jgi:hypothetical protein
LNNIRNLFLFVVAPTSPRSRYHGRIILPNEYPNKPPQFLFCTHNGRFEVGKKICLSISQHHPEEWQAAWGVRAALTAIRSFMTTKADGEMLLVIGTIIYPLFDNIVSLVRCHRGHGLVL